MASLINWDDFENQALAVQELISNHPEEMANSPNFTHNMTELEDSPLIISKIEEPQDLVLLESPDISLNAVEKIEIFVSPLKKVNVKYEDKQKDFEFRTPLKDCTNNSQKDIIKLLNDSTKITPVKSTISEKTSSILCPSSAEFREFLNAITDVSPVEKNSSFEDLGGEAVKHCQSQVVTDSNENVPVKSARARSGTYNLPSPTFNLGGLCDPANTVSKHEVELFTKSSSDLLTSDTSFKDTVSNESTVFVNGFSSYKCDVKMISKEDCVEKQRLEDNENNVMDNGIQTFKDNTEVQKQLLVATGDDLDTDVLKPSPRHLLKKPIFRRPGDKSFDREMKHKASNPQIVNSEPILLQFKESADHINVGESIALESNLKCEKTLPDTDNKFLENKKLDCISESIVVYKKTEFKEDADVIINVSSSKDICIESQKSLDVLHKVPVLKKDDLTSKTEPQASNILTRNVTYTKLPFMKSKHTNGSTNSIDNPTTLKAAQAGKTEGSDASLMPKTIANQRSVNPSQRNRETYGASKMLFKPSCRASTKITDQSQWASNIHEQSDKLKVKTKVLEEENVKIMQQQDSHFKNPLQKPCPSRIATKITRKASVINGIINESRITKDTSFSIKPPPPVVDASKTVSKVRRNSSAKALEPADGSRTITKKTSPVKALFAVNGSRTVKIEDQSLNSRTVTKEDQPVLSRTITKDVQPAGFKTVTKTSGGQVSNATRNHQSTPLKSDKPLAPRRLSNVFYAPTSLSSSSQNSVSRNNSFKKPLLESPFSDMKSNTAECEGFKPKLALVQNTPEVKQRRLSMWSPVKKNRMEGPDLAYQCTKKLRDSQDKII